VPLREVERFAVSYLQVLGEDGLADAKLDPRLSNEELIELYEGMFLAREVDQRMLKLQRQGRLGTCPLCTGQEAAVCSVALAMTEEDYFVGYYRELGARLMLGESLPRHFRYWNGEEEGAWQPHKRRTLPVTAIIGAQVPHAVGVAYALKHRGESDSAVVCFFGDGATSQGDVHEAMNFAGVWQVPIVFICLNNQWAISHPASRQTASTTFAQKAIAYGFEGLQVDGNDALAMVLASRKALERARSGGGPTLIEAVTYRLMMHTTADDPKRYRDDEEVDQWWRRDPLPRLRRYLERRQIWDANRQRDMEQRVGARIDRDVVTFEKDSRAERKPDAPFDHVFAQGSNELARQRRSFLDAITEERKHG
jgi:pyruvate dehydrogenase E1 component alpha subunit